MHDFYSSHLHSLPPHITSSHNPSSSPVSHVSHLHQLHNSSLASFPHHPSVSASLPVNASPPNHSIVYSPSTITQNTENHGETTNQDENHNNSHTQTQNQSGNDSPSSTGVHYTSGINLPPTPNSLVTMMGPNSGIKKIYY